jgi:nascent polypeptide-associated complex subunit beta
MDKSSTLPLLKVFDNFTLLSLVHAAPSSNTFAVYGQGEEKDLTELVPGILNQLGADNLASLRHLAETFQQKGGVDGLGGAADGADEDDEDVPDLVENIDDVDKQD